VPQIWLGPCAGPSRGLCGFRLHFRRRTGCGWRGRGPSRTEEVTRSGICGRYPHGWVLGYP
jgi:hypothetical protein